MAIKKPVLGVVLFCLACLIAILLVTPLFLAGTVIDAVDGEAQVHIETDHTWVAFPWDCYNVSWAVFNTASVYLDGGGVIGEYTRQECIDWRNAPAFERTHIYTINKADGTSRDFPFTQYVLVGRVEFWLGLLLVVGLVVASDHLGGSPRQWLWMRRGLLALPNRRVSLLPERINKPQEKVLVSGAVIVIFVAGLLLRLNHVYLLGENNYPAWAYNYYYGGITYTYIQFSGITHEDVPPERRIVYPMGYPALLSVLNSVGLDYTGIRSFQAVFDALSIIPLFLMLRRLRLSIWASLFGALIYALYPVLIAGSVIMLAEWISPSLIVWTMYTLLCAADSTKWQLWLIPGLILGLLSLFRPEALLIVGVAGLWLLWQRWSWRRTFMAASAMGVGFAVFTGIAGLNNLSLTGRFSIASSAGGYALWAGLGMIPNDYGYFVDDARAIQLLATMGIEFHTSEANQYFTSEYFAAWRERPLYVLSTLGFRWQKILSQQDITALYATQNPAYPDAISLGMAVQSAWWLLPIALLISYRHKKRLFALLFPMMAALFTVGLVYVETRYVRYTFISYLIAAVITLEWLVNGVRQAIYYGVPRWQQRMVNIGLAGLVVGIAFYFSVPQFSRLSALLASHQATENVRAAFTTENRTPRYTISELYTYSEGDNVRIEPEQGWSIAPSSWGGFSFVQATIPLQGEQFVSVHLDVELAAGSAYISLIGDVERDQVLLQTPGRQTVDLTSYVGDLSGITIKVMAYNNNANTLIRVESIDVYITP